MRNILCIDLKSFFASCECIERKLDPFKSPLVVADPDRHGGAITLAVTPYLKKLGVKSRGRIFEIPKNLKYITAKPRMSLYIKKSSEVINVYLNFVSKNDMHIYSIDEVFLDVTNYLSLYKMTDYELALTIIKEVEKNTGLVSTCGIGPNMLLAKVAMDIEAKHNKNNIAKWNYSDIKTKLWNIKPLSKMWGIGKKTETKLNKMGINSIGDLAKFNKSILINKFGVIGLELWEHSNGIDNSIINNSASVIKEKSICVSSILYKNYYEFNIKIILKELISTLTTRLRKEKQLTTLISLGISYSKEINSGFHHQIKLEIPTDNEKSIFETCEFIFDKHYQEDFPIRKVSLTYGKLVDNSFHQLSIFEDYNSTVKNNTINATIDYLHFKYGKNSINKASSLLKDSNIIKRNNKIGGHNG